MRLIDADALDDVIQDLNENHNRGITRGEYKRISAVLWEFPTIEPQRKKGKWIIIGKTRESEGDSDYDFQCSVCGYTDCHNVNVEVPYCWHCGAEMTGGDEEWEH